MRGGGGRGRGKVECVQSEFTVSPICMRAQFWPGPKLEARQWPAVWRHFWPSGRRFVESGAFVRCGRIVGAPLGGPWRPRPDIKRRRAARLLGARLKVTSDARLSTPFA